MFLIKSFAVSVLFLANPALASSWSGNILDRPAAVQSKLSLVENSQEFLELRELLANHRRVSSLGRTKSIQELTLLSGTESNQLAHLFSTFMPGTAFDGLCFVRNYFWQLILEDLGVKSASAMLRKTVSKLRPQSEDAKDTSAHRRIYHIAPTVCVGENNQGCDQLAILDPAFSGQALSVSQWRAMAQGDTRFIRMNFFEPGVVSPQDIHEGKSALSQDGMWSLKDHRELGAYLEKMRFAPLYE